MKAVSPESCRAAERHAMELFGLQEDVLMERASWGAWEVFRGLSPQARRLVVLCGPGSNGGDGLALARHAWVAGICPRVVRVGNDPAPESTSGRQLSILRKMGVESVGWQDFRRSDDFLGEHDSVAVDALFGTGLKRPLQGDAAEAARWLSARPTLALDLPSGLDGATGQPLGGCVKAVATVTFARAKPGLFLHPGRDYAGTVHVVEIGIPADSWQFAGGGVEILDRQWASNRLKPRPRGSHKGAAGRGFLLCGSDAYLGAAVMSSSAALRSGLGLLQVGSTESVASRIAMVLPEAMGMVAIGEAVDRPDLAKRIARSDAVLAGPGLGQSSEAFAALQMVLDAANSPLVLDADALNLCALHSSLREQLERIASAHGAVLTPHPLEASRLLECGLEVLLADPIAAARSLADRFGAVAIFKSATPVVASPDGQVAIGIAGHSGMAVGGCGDALAGAVLARLAEGETAFDAACQAVRAHARAGDLAGEKGRRGMSVTDLIAQLPAAWEEMEIAPSV